ncbi:Rha family transcriptional regulator [Alkalimonas sp. NCh-2]|uniref:Rha family transcriptional regulator n=1 Tax=Alkalimonas sp. NCh-2 TaxID=3144846 RepID=UPI0031F63088
MAQISIVPDSVVNIIGDQVKTTSLKVAECFGKRHDNVLSKLKSLDCSPEFHLLNFKEVLRDVPGGDGAIRKMPMYEMTKDGFIFLVMGFTGKKAAQIKEAYINAFNWMAEKLKKQSFSKTSTDERTGLRNAVNLLVSKKGLMYPEAYNLIHHRFNVEHLDELTKDQLPQAVEYVHRLVLEGEYLPASSNLLPGFASEQEANATWTNLHALCRHAEMTLKVFDECGMRRFLRQLDSKPGRQLIEHVQSAGRLAGMVHQSCQELIIQAKKSI